MVTMVKFAPTQMMAKQKLHRPLHPRTVHASLHLWWLAAASTPPVMWEEHGWALTKFLKYGSNSLSFLAVTYFCLLHCKGCILTIALVPRLDL